jgi:hypothetical protein
VRLHERQAGHADGLLKFRFAKGTKEPILLREGELEQPVERAKDFSYEIFRPPF